MKISCLSSFDFNKEYLYILIIDRVFYKFGISTKGRNRIFQHCKNYNVDLKKSFIITGNNIKRLEKQIEYTIDPLKENPYNGKDGYTEIRSISSIGIIYSIIKTRNLQIYNLSELKQCEKIRNARIKVTKEDRKIILEKFLLKAKSGCFVEVEEVAKIKDFVMNEYSKNGLKMTRKNMGI